MSASYTLADRRRAYGASGFERVLITGAGGRIGGSLAAYSHERYSLRMLVQHPDSVAEVESFGEVIVGDLADSGGLADVFAGVDTVVHLAADPSPTAEWDSVHRNNILATYNVYAAAVAAACRRVIFASSIHAVSGYPKGYQVHADDPVNPGDLYGVSKCFGEALARMRSVQQGISCIVLRIGGFQTREDAATAEDVALMDAFVSHRDLNQLICRCIDDDRLQFATFHALSNNRFNRMDITAARELVGYAPDDDFTELNEQLRGLEMRERVTPHDTRHRTSANS